LSDQAIPEAVGGDAYSRKDLESKQFRSLPILSQQARLFPADSNVTIDDAARAWIRPTETSRREVSVSSMSVAVAPSNGASSVVFNEIAGSGMPFDMDISLQLSAASVGLTGQAGVGKVSPTTLSAFGSMDESDQVESIAKSASMVMSMIDTDRIPCPRLCGAVFSPAVGGFVGTIDLSSLFE
jgi:hypothetical protein